MYEARVFMTLRHALYMLQFLALVTAAVFRLMLNEVYSW